MLEWSEFVIAVMCATTLACGTSTSVPDGGADASSDAATCPGLTGNWTCVGKESLPAVTSTTIDQPFFILEQTNGKPVVNVPIKACALADTSCATPVVGAQTTDATGAVTFVGLPTGAKGFDGYFEIDAANDTPNLNFIDPPFFTAFPIYGRGYWSGSDITDVATLGGVTLDTSRGQLFIQVHDCSEFPNSVACVQDGGCPTYFPGGVTLSIDVSDPKIVTGYITLTGGVFGVSRTATCTADQSGSGGFFNVPPGPVTITGKLANGVTMATLHVFVRAGAISLVVLPPTL